MSVEKIKLFWSNVKKTPGCWLWVGGRFLSGYGRFWTEGKLKRSHRVSWELTNGQIPDGLHVLHRCDNPICVNPKHLRLGTHQENMTDKKSKGRAPGFVGEAHPSAKLTEQKVIKIRKEYAKGSTSHRKLAEAFGISNTQIQYILTRKSWSHV